MATRWNGNLGSWNLQIDTGVDERLKLAANRGLAIAGEYVLGESNKKVPIEEYDLGRSGSVSRDPANDRIAIFYDTPYAKRQHQDLTYRHDEGRTAKFLENAINGSTAEVRAIIAAAIRGDL